MTEKKLSLDKRLTAAIRKWDSFVITPTLNGFVLSEGSEPNLERAIVTEHVADVQDYFETWANENEKVKDDDDGED